MGAVPGCGSSTCNSPSSRRALTRLGSPHCGFTFPLLLVSLFSIVLGSLGEDVAETVQQFGTLVIQPTCHWQVCPLHPLAQNEHSDDGVGIDDRLSLDEPLNLLD